MIVLFVRAVFFVIGVGAETWRPSLVCKLTEIDRKAHALMLTEIFTEETSVHQLEQLNGFTFPASTPGK